MMKGGFTLLELLLVIVIIGIVASFSVVSFRDLIVRYQIENQIQEMYSDVMNLRLNAMHRNRTCFLLISSSGYKGYEDSYPPPFGDDNLDENKDNLILPEKTVRFPLSYSSGEITVFDQRGFSKTNKTVCVFSNVSPQYDCMKISKAKVRIGKIIDLSGPCNSENCKEVQ